METTLHSNRPSRVKLSRTSPDQYGYWPGRPHWDFQFELKNVRCWGKTMYLGVLNMYGVVEDLTFNLILIPTGTRTPDNAFHLRHLLDETPHNSVYLDVLGKSNTATKLRRDGYYSEYRMQFSEKLRSYGLAEIATTAANGVLNWRDQLRIVRVHES